MLDNLLFYFRLTWLCLRLAFNLFVFALRFLLIKINHHRIIKICLLFLIVLSWGAIFFLIKQKTTPQIQLTRVEILENKGQELPIRQREIVDETEIADKIKFLEEIEKKDVKSLGLFLNLSQLNKAIGQDEQAREYFEKAQQIAPQINYLENN